MSNANGYIKRFGRDFPSSDAAAADVVYRTQAELQTGFDAYTTAKSTVPTVFKLGAGTVTITGTFSIPANCTLRGAGMDDTIVVGEVGSNPIIIVNTDAVLEDVQVRKLSVATWNTGGGTATSRRVFFNNTDDALTDFATVLANDDATHYIIDCEYRLNAVADMRLIYVGDTSSMVIRGLHNRRADKSYGCHLQGNAAAVGGFLHATDCEFGSHAIVPEYSTFINCAFRPSAVNVPAIDPNTTMVHNLTYVNCVFDMTTAGPTTPYGLSYAGDTMRMFNCSVIGNTLAMTGTGTVLVSTAVTKS